jgi:NADPH-dependent curcumin reductase CurA
MSLLNGRVLFNEPPSTVIVPGKHLVYETSSIDVNSVPLNGGVLAKTRVLSPDPYMRGKLRQRDAKKPYGFDLGKPCVPTL